MYFHTSDVFLHKSAVQQQEHAFGWKNRIYLAIHLALEIIAPILKAPITLPSGGHWLLQQQKFTHHARRPSD